MPVSIDELSINTIRTLSIDAIEKANSGHPGLPMGAAPMAYTLWAKKMKHNPANPNWFNRDRFVLSAGHGSMLLYSLLHLFGYGLPLEELKQFRQWGSRTPGHPEYGHTAGIEATTGPLGQGIAMAVGMAMAEAHLAATYNHDDYEIVNHHTYALCGDGDLMEGVASEAASLAGRLALGRLVLLYDSNKISLDGRLDMSFSENVRQRFDAYGWQTLLVTDGNDVSAVKKALDEAAADENRPTLIEVCTTIGYGAPGVAGTNKVHGNPLGAEAAAGAKKAYGWTSEPFTVPEDVRAHFQEIASDGQKAEDAWRLQFAAYEQAYPELAAQLKRAINGELPVGYADQLPIYEPGTKKATRATSGEVINGLAGTVPQLFGGAADLSSSTKTTIQSSGDFLPSDYSGRNVWFGVREFAMFAAANGMALHGGVIPFGATFFTFSDYAKPAIRLAALMGIPSIFVFTHDSIAVGEDGPTHEPIEQLAGLRAIPNLNVIRPADGNEVREAWKLAVESRNRPTVLVLTRQNVETIVGEAQGAAEGIRKGGYIVSETASGRPEAILIATGSEVALAASAQKLLQQQGTAVRVVSLPSWELFQKQPQAYRDAVLPPEITARVGIEMAASLGWHEFVGSEGALVTIDQFGASAPSDQVIAEYGFTPEKVAAITKKLVKDLHNI
ncbi:transketolase [Sporolactobacillus terrae]|uniref:Transketolase n=1 Tax=Sporolactobacillus terrae TaxID=269673 RepID=A0ABX5Q4P9_9BACL|nr:transketolase [Sporolactobacillus terrae]QAA21609.1 transketolase [Sporolactobacillus terrae]QAA24581.1 transketolase [Sporolactobacillus terrae]UAK16418.1 transketolase [Sporolactobacillus terrae]